MTKPNRPSRLDARPEAPAMSPRWRDIFITHLAETSNVSASAEAAGVTTSRVYAERRRNSVFLRKWHEALCEGYEHLEMYVLYRLRSGDNKDLTGSKYDYATALKLIHAHRETVARERALRDNRSEQEVLDSIDAMIGEMRERSLANQAIIDADEPDFDDEEG